MANFNLGVVAGASMSSVLLGALGFQPMLCALSGFFIGMAVFIRNTIMETKPQPPPSEDEKSGPLDQPVRGTAVISGMVNSYPASIQAWRLLLQRRDVAEYVTFAAVASVATTTVQQTLLPLLILGPTFSLGASGVASAFAFIAVVSVLGSTPIALFADKVGKLPALTIGKIEAER